MNKNESTIYMVAMRYGCIALCVTVVSVAVCVTIIFKPPPNISSVVLPQRQELQQITAHNEKVKILCAETVEISGHNADIEIVEPVTNLIVKGHNAKIKKVDR